jgi:hypothetical protein
MRCLDTDEDQLLADLPYESLLREVQKPGLPFEVSTPNYREIQIRAFWDNVTMQLRFDEGSREDEWPEGYPETSSGLEE